MCTFGTKLGHGNIKIRPSLGSGSAGGHSNSCKHLTNGVKMVYPKNCGRTYKVHIKEQWNTASLKFCSFLIMLCMRWFVSFINIDKYVYNQYLDSFSEYCVFVSKICTWTEWYISGKIGNKQVMKLSF